MPRLSSQQSAPLSVASAVVKMLEDMGVRYAFGVSGGAMRRAHALTGIAPLWAELQQSEIQVLHFRHEAGAAFAGVEAYFASGRPVVVFTTTGTGSTNALTGLFAARWEGTETSTYTMPSAGVFTSGALFHYATTLECSDELPKVSRRFALGLARPGGFVAHLSIPTAIQTSSSKEFFYE